MLRLPQSRSFLVQLSDQTDSEARLPEGRVEHIESGVRGRFSSREELWDFMAEILARQEEEEP